MADPLQIELAEKVLSLAVLQADHLAGQLAAIHQRLHLKDHPVAAHADLLAHSKALLLLENVPFGSVVVIVCVRVGGSQVLLDVPALQLRFRGFPPESEVDLKES